MPRRQRPFEYGRRLVSGCFILQLAAWNGFHATGFTCPLAIVRTDWPNRGIRRFPGHRKRRLIVHDDYPFHTKTVFALPLADDDYVLSENSIRDRTRWSTSRLLQELDKRGIRYSPTSSRTDLENLLLDTLTNSVALKETSGFVDGHGDNTSTNDSPVDEALDRLKRRARRRQWGQSRQTTSSPQLFSSWSRTVVNQVPKVAGTLLDRASRKARRLQRRAADFWALDDETGVRDARFQYLQRNSPPSGQRLSDANVEVIVDASDTTRAFGTHESVFRPPSAGTEPNRFRTRSASTSYQSQPQRQRRSDVAAPTESGPLSNDSSTRPWINPSSTIRPMQLDKSRLLPPSDQLRTPSPHVSNQPRRPRRPSSQSTPESTPPPKKVYSPYGEAANSSFLFDSEAMSHLDRDVVDKVSEFLANAADKVMWGTFDKNQPDEVAAPDPNGRRRTEPTNRPPRIGKQPPPRHWKDRLEESLDSVLGLHEDGTFYNRWTSQFNKESADSDGTNDAFSVAQGRQVRKRPRRYDKPFWEEEGNIFALLFGRTRSGRDLFFDDRIELGSSGGSLLLVLRAAIKSFLIVTSYLCRWASTQGALPQPIVVMGVGAAALCAQPRRRVMTVVITLLLLRTVGEVLHGYASGTNGWEGEVDENETDESNEYDGSGTS